MGSGLSGWIPCFLSSTLLLPVRHMREAAIFWLLVFNKCLYLSVAWSSVNLRTNTKKDMCSKEIGLCAQNMSSILDLTINIIGYPAGGGRWENLLIIQEERWCSLQQWMKYSHELHKIIERFGYMHDLDFLLVSPLIVCFVSYGKWGWLKPRPQTQVPSKLLC